MYCAFVDLKKVLDRVPREMVRWALRKLGVDDWFVRTASLLDKGLKVNAGKSKVMVGSSGGKTIVNSGKWPSGVCGNGVQANSVQCTVCKKLIHKRCSGVRGDLARVADGFRCRRCDGTIHIPVNSPDIVGSLPIWRLVSRPPDSYLKSPDIKVGSRPTADRTAFAGDRLVPVCR